MKYEILALSWIITIPLILGIMAVVASRMIARAAQDERGADDNNASGRTGLGSSPSLNQVAAIERLNKAQEELLSAVVAVTRSIPH